MGDRANIVNITGPESIERVCLYVHSLGSALPEIASTGIMYAQPRWGDASYALRMALTKWIGDMTGDTGAGVSHDMGDNEHPLLVIDWHKSRVTVIEWEHYTMVEFELSFMAALEAAHWFSFQDLEAHPDLLRMQWDSVHRAHGYLQ